MFARSRLTCPSGPDAGIDVLAPDAVATKELAAIFVPFVAGTFIGRTARESRFLLLVGVELEVVVQLAAEFLLHVEIGLPLAAGARCEPHRAPEIRMELRFAS